MIPTVVVEAKATLLIVLNDTLRRIGCKKLVCRAYLFSWKKKSKFNRNGCSTSVSAAIPDGIKALADESIWVASTYPSLTSSVFSLIRAIIPAWVRRLIVLPPLVNTTSLIQLRKALGHKWPRAVPVATLDLTVNVNPKTALVKIPILETSKWTVFPPVITLGKDAGLILSHWTDWYGTTLDVSL